jgi:hypothetical protein
MVWSGTKDYDIFLKLWNLNGTYLRFFKDPNNNAGNNRFQLFNPISKKGELFDIFSKTSEWPTLCVLLGYDYSQNHAVTVVNDWILESNSDFAMKLTKENLD